MKHIIEIGDEVYDELGIDYMVVNINAEYTDSKETPIIYILQCEHHDPDNKESFSKEMAVPRWALED